MERITCALVGFGWVWGGEDIEGGGVVVVEEEIVGERGEEGGEEDAMAQKGQEEEWEGERDIVVCVN